jgi:hypothetical protein
MVQFGLDTVYDLFEVLKIHDLLADEFENCSFHCRAGNSVISACVTWLHFGVTAVNPIVAGVMAPTERTS